MTQTLAHTSLDRIKGLLAVWLLLGAASLGGYVWVWGVPGPWALIGAFFFGSGAATYLWLPLRTVLRLNKNGRVALALSRTELTYILWAKPVALADIRDIAVIRIGDTPSVRIRLNNGGRRSISNDHIDQRAATVADALRAAITLPSVAVTAP